MDGMTRFLSWLLCVFAWFATVLLTTALGDVKSARRTSYGYYDPDLWDAQRSLTIAFVLIGTVTVMGSIVLLIEATVCLFDAWRTDREARRKAKQRAAKPKPQAPPPPRSRPTPPPPPRPEPPKPPPSPTPSPNSDGPGPVQPLGGAANPVPRQYIVLPDLSEVAA